MDQYIIIVILAIIIITAVFIYFLYNIKSINIVQTTTQTSSGQTISSVGIICPSGNCSTSISNGSKICPQQAVEQLIIDPTTSVCSEPLSCSSANLPFAINADGSTNLNGVCDGFICRCTATPSCANENLVSFNATGGTVFNGELLGQRLSIMQELITRAPIPSGIPSNINVFVPVALDSTTTSFCTISNSWLPFLSPGNCGIFDTLTSLGMSECMVSNPCMVGTLAFIPSSPSTFDSTQISTTPLACVYGSSTDCNNTQLAVWDSTNNKIKCVPI
jgi:hypothetical protein